MVRQLTESVSPRYHDFLIVLDDSFTTRLNDVNRCGR